MKISLHRLLGATIAITVVACLIAFIVRHAKHGFALYLGDVAWFTFLAGVVVTGVLGLATLVYRTRRRLATR